MSAKARVNRLPKSQKRVLVDSRDLLMQVAKLRAARGEDTSQIDEAVKRIDNPLYQRSEQEPEQRQEPGATEHLCEKCHKAMVLGGIFNDKWECAACGIIEDVAVETK